MNYFAVLVEIFLQGKIKLSYQLEFMKFIILIFIIFTTNIYASVGEDVVSPVSNSDSKKILLIGASATLLAVAFDKTFSKKFQQNIYKEQTLCCKIIEPGNKFLQIVPNILYSFGFGISYLFTKDNEDKLRAVGMAKASLYSGLITDMLKHVVYEKRPNGGGTSSFPSGHTTSAFAFASYVASEHPWYAGVSAYILASYVGFCRMQANAHHLKDVIAGATIGMSYGVASRTKVLKLMITQNQYLC